LSAYSHFINPVCMVLVDSNPTFQSINRQYKALVNQWIAKAISKLLKNCNAMCQSVNQPCKNLCQSFMNTKFYWSITTVQKNN